MYAIKIIQTHKDGRQLIELLSGSEINYEFGTYKNPDEFGEQITKLLVDRNHFQYHGHSNQNENLGVAKQFVVLSVWEGNEWGKHVIEDSWIYIMLNGKTIDKLEVIT